MKRIIFCHIVKVDDTILLVKKINYSFGEDITFIVYK